MKDTLTRPTVADLIEALRRYPQDAPVALIDADTGWLIRKFHVGQETSNGYAAIPADHIYLWNQNYKDMDSD